MAGQSKPKFTLPVTASQLESLAVEFSDFARRLELAAKIAKTQPEQTLGIYNWPSVPKGLRMIRSFVAKVDDSRSAAELGNPLAIGQLTPRSTLYKQMTESEASKIVAKLPRKKKRP